MSNTGDGSLCWLKSNLLHPHKESSPVQFENKKNGDRFLRLSPVCYFKNASIFAPSAYPFLYSRRKAFLSFVYVIFFCRNYC